MTFFDPGYNPYSGILWTHFAPIFRKSKSQAFQRVVWRKFEVRWKVLTLANRTVGQTSKSDHLGPISWVLKWPSRHEIGFWFGKNVGKKIQLFGNSAVSNVMKSTPRGQISASESPFPAPGSVLSSALRIGVVRHTWELVVPYFWKPSKNVEIGAKCVHKVPKSGLSTDCTWEVKIDF